MRKSDIENAKTLHEQFSDQFCYVPTWGWMRWTRKVWERDLKGLHIRKAAHQILGEGSTTRVEGMLREARSLFAVPDSEFDQDPMLLNLQDGVLDLRTFELMPHSPELRLTRIAGCAFGNPKPNSRWEKFVEEVIDDPEAREFVQRAVGYTLTGLTCEQCLFLLVGSGANGKTTFLETIKAMLGDYAVTSDFSAFLARNQTGPRSEIARLRGARLAIASEAPVGSVLNEVTLKLLTGQDTLPARFMYQEYFEFKPTLKLWMAVNHLPEIKDHTNAIWRRIRVIRFNRTFDNPDPELPDRLRGELSEVLAWALDGLAEYHRQKLSEPQSIARVTEIYRADSDQVGMFLAEMTIPNPKSSIRVLELYRSYKKWCGEYGLEPYSLIEFARRLSGRGFSRRRTNQATYLVGLALRSAN